jgi:glucose/arabinose dehydrogenase
LPQTSFANARLIHVLPGGDYGWKQARTGKASDATEAMAVRPDPIRASATGDRPGTLLSMLRLDPGSSGSLIAYHGAAFPEFFQGLLIVTVGEGQAVRAYSLERDGATFRVNAQFDLVQSDGPRFRVNHIVQGPDGASMCLV